VELALHLYLVSSVFESWGHWVEYLVEGQGVICFVYIATRWLVGMGVYSRYCACSECWETSLLSVRDFWRTGSFVGDSL